MKEKTKTKCCLIRSKNHKELLWGKQDLNQPSQK